ncbi:MULTISPECIES: LysR family transcriptional regulator [unclassified Tatumella]|uniref:LysR family transcriptional regulator n=1 Tax=unclassified Tatumella TaxID=2649542 RepID=UPI001BAF0251|nr:MULTISPECIES: LysR family transcriptional regulator [unclassified Tatumella]MBS0855133.1 LysR family transcriptional regulator [Tatumella sp. JGM16]MBS0912028.1 LysR family transcriptional regulator [Tatumella sp. JGM91]
MERLECDRMFIAVVEAGSFTAAARRLHTSHGQASKLISRLEHILGVQLFRRSTRSLAVTEVGLAYYQRVRALIDEYDALNDAIRHTSEAPAGRLRISAPVTFGTTQLTPRLIDFAGRYPDIELDVSYADRLVNIIDEGFDLALRIGSLPDSSLMARKLCDIRILLVASPQYLARRGTPQHWSALEHHDCIIDTNFRDPFRWPFSAPAGGLQEQAVSGRLKFSNAEVCLQAVTAGLGIARLPTFVAGDALKRLQVVTVLDDYAPAPLGLFALYPPAKYLAHKSRAMIDYLAETFTAIPDWDQGW